MYFKVYLAKTKSKTIIRFKWNLQQTIIPKSNKWKDKPCIGKRNHMPNRPNITIALPRAAGLFDLEERKLHEIARHEIKRVKVAKTLNKMGLFLLTYIRPRTCGCIHLVLESQNLFLIIMVGFANLRLLFKRSILPLKAANVECIYSQTVSESNSITICSQ